MTQEFAGKTALVTGSGSGIGRAIALAFAAAGANVVASDRDTQGGEETLALIEAQGGCGTFIQVDVTRGDDVSRMVQFAVASYGRLDIACNNAGIAHGRRLVTDFSEEEWDSVMAVNLRGVWLSMKYEIPELLKQPTSAIVNTASISGLVGTPLSAAYTASKHGVIGLTKTVALDYAATGLRVNAICPGITRTPIIGSAPETAAKMASLVPMARLAEPAEIANAVLWLCSSQASYVNGHSLVADGAYTVL